MRKYLIMARSNMRSAKGQTVAIVVLVLLAAILLNLWLMLSMDYHANFDRYHDKLNAEHVVLSVDGDTEDVRDFLTQTLDNDAQVAEYRLDSCLNMSGSFTYNGGNMSGWFVFLEKDIATTRTVGKSDMTEDSDIASGIYMPMLYKSDDIAVGKTMKLQIGSRRVEYTVCGFFNNVMMGSHNCKLTEIMLTADKYAELAETGYAPRATLCSVRLHDVSENLNFQSDLKSAVTSRFPNTTIVGSSYDIVAQSRYVSQSIVSAIMCVMAFLILLICLVVIVSNIVNYVQANMKNLGALKAVGYTSRQLILSLLFQFLLLTLAATVIGVGVSYCLFPAVNSMMISQTGIPYAVRFLPLPALITLIIPCAAVALSVWLAARGIKKIEPIVALRSGVATHSFKRNHVPLEKTRVPLNFALALKTTLSGVKNNITVCITMLVLSLVVAFSGLLIENALTDITPFIELVAGETADSCITIDVDAEDDFLSAVNADSRVEKAYLYSSLDISHAGGADLTATMCDDFSLVNNKSVVYTGRFPKYDNEIAIGAKYAREHGFDVGDEIEMTANGKTAKYLICGLSQNPNSLGRDCLLTRSGFERIGEFSTVSYYLDLLGGTDIDAFNAETEERFDGKVFDTVNIDKTIQGASSVYVTLITVIVIAILVLSVLIIAFVLYLLIRMMLNNKKRDYGIMKALGFTTGQLIVQTALAFMPAIVISTVVGIIVGALVVNPLMGLFLRGLGVVKCTFGVPVVSVTVAGIGIMALAFGIACLLSLRIRKIAPRALLAGE
ncbi:MAG: ABC transporter permease [Roseburia sp.]|nr:ABC transporter permease [Roseburia sp.]